MPLDAYMVEAMAVFATAELGAHAAAVLYNRENDFVEMIRISSEVYR